MAKEDKKISFDTLNTIFDEIIYESKNKEKENERAFNEMAKLTKTMVDSFENQGFSHEDAMRICTEMIKAMLPGGEQ